MRQTVRQTHINPVRAALDSCKPHFVNAAIFSAVSNILALVPSIYMMQIYDRVVPTGGTATLLLLSLVALFGLATMSALDWLRGRLLVRAGAKLDAELAGRTLHLIMTRPRIGSLARSDAMRHLDTLRQGVSTPAAAAIFDIPWAPLYIVASFLLHPVLGLLSLGAAILLLILAWDNERSIRTPVRIVAEAGSAAYSQQAQITSFAGDIRALGMADALSRLVLAERAKVNMLQASAGFIGGNHSSLLKFLRMALQSAALGVGAILVVKGEASGGAIFAASLLLGRALAPIDQVVAAWKTILQTRTAYDKLSELFDAEGLRIHTVLPAPTGAIEVEHLIVTAPGSDRVAVSDINFTVAPGEVIALIGASGSGKSTLLRALAGADLPARGFVRFDGASVEDWDSETLAPHVGYLPQSFVLFQGSVKDNIARFQTAAEDASPALDLAVIAAARSIGAHDMILRLPQGYDTPIGHRGMGLSAGQAQRIAIARALFRSPRILLLDEPTANLDADAQRAFETSMSQLRRAGSTVIFSTHSPELLKLADKLMVLREGRIERFGPVVAETRAINARPNVHASWKAAS